MDRGLRTYTHNFEILVAWPMLRPGGGPRTSVENWKYHLNIHELQMHSTGLKHGARKR
jgi:hypothetical protein